MDYTNFLPEYPNIDDPKFQQKILNKKEFNELRLAKSLEKVGKGEFLNVSFSLLTLSEFFGLEPLDLLSAVDLASFTISSLSAFAFSKVANDSLENIEKPSPSFSFIISIMKLPGFLKRAINLTICGISFEIISTINDKNTLVAPKA